MLNINTITFIFTACYGALIFKALYFQFLSLDVSYSDTLSRKLDKGLLKPNSVVKEQWLSLNYSADFTCLLIIMLSFRTSEVCLANGHLAITQTSYALHFFTLFVLWTLTKLIQKFYFGLQQFFKGPGLHLVISLFTLVLPVFYTTNLLAFFFFLELSSLLLFFFLVSNPEAFMISSNNPAAKSKINPIRLYYSALFFQFWASFFGSTLMMYSCILLFYSYGSLAWVDLELLCSVSANVAYFGNPLASKLGFALAALALVIKLALPPLFFYKLEIYKALPLPLLFFYSVLYFIFFIFLAFYFFSFCFYFSVKLLISLAPVLGLFLFGFFISALFDNYLLRNFLGLSSLINVIIVAIILLGL